MTSVEHYCCNQYNVAQLLLLKLSKVESVLEISGPLNVGGMLYNMMDDQCTGAICYTKRLSTST